MSDKSLYETIKETIISKLNASQQYANSTIEECRFERTKALDQVLQNLKLENSPFNILIIAVMIFLGSCVIFSALRFYAFILFENKLRWTSPFTLGSFIFYGRFEPDGLEKENEYLKSVREKGGHDYLTDLKIFLGWSYHTISYSKDKVRKLTGECGTRYLSNSKWLIHLLVIAIVCAFVPYGLNTAGGLGSGVPSLWGLSTLANISPIVAVGSAHLFFTVISEALMFISALIRIHNSSEDHDFERSKTVILLRNISNNKNEIESFFAESGIRPSGFKLIQDDYKLKKIETELKINEKISEELNQEEQNTLVYTDSWNVWKFWHLNAVTAAEYYRSTQQELEKKLSEAKDCIKPIGAAFVTFSTPEEALDALELFGRWRKVKKVIVWLLRKLANKSDSTNTRAETIWWSASLAPPDEDIVWENLNIHLRQKWYKVKCFLRWPLIFSISAAGLILPAYLLDLAYKNIIYFQGFLGGSIVLPALKYFMNVMIMNLLLYIDKWAGHTRKSRLQSAELHFTLWFQVISEIVLPMLNFLHVIELVNWIVSVCYGSDFSPRLRCVLRPTFGIDQASTIIAFSFVRNILMMLRIPHLFHVNWWEMKTNTEYKVRLQNKSIAFDTGTRYAELLFQFAMAITCSNSQPLVLLISLPCALVRYFIDKHNLCHTYAITSGDDYIHKQIIPLALPALVFQNTILVIFNVLRDKENATWLSPLTVTSLCLLIFVSIASIAFTPIYNLFGKLLTAINRCSQVRNQRAFPTEREVEEGHPAEA